MLLRSLLSNATTNVVGSIEPDRYIRLPELKSLTGFKGTAHIYKLMARGEFPRPIRLGERAVAWKLSDIHAYLTSRPIAQYTGPSYARSYDQTARQRNTAA